MNMSEVFLKISKVLMLEMVALFYINAVFTIRTVSPTHVLNLLVKMCRALHKNTL